VKALDAEYGDIYKQAVELEDQVKANQNEINDLKEQMRQKKRTLKTYEQVLRRPDGSHTEIFRCVCCGKNFMTNSYLQHHYKKRHPDYYLQLKS